MSLKQLIPKFKWPQLANTQLCISYVELTRSLYPSSVSSQEHVEELRNNNIQNSKLFYLRQDHSKNAKKLKRNKQYLADLQDDLQERRGSVALMSCKISKVCADRILQSGCLLEKALEHQRLCAEREERIATQQFAEAFARKLKDEKVKGRSCIRRFFERIFGGQDGLQRQESKKQLQEEKLNNDVFPMFYASNSDDAKNAVHLLKQIDCESSRLEGTADRNNRCRRSRLSKFFKRQGTQNDSVGGMSKLLRTGIEKLDF